MIKVTTEIKENNECDCLEICTRVLIGVENRYKKGADVIIKKEIKCLLSELVEKKPDLLFSAIEEVIGEGLQHD